MDDSNNDVNETDHFTFTWTIENICGHCVVESPVFTVQAIENTKWYLVANFGYLGFISLYLCRTGIDDGPENIQIKYELAILEADCTPLIKKLDVKTFSDFSPLVHQNLTLHDVMIYLRRVHYLPNDALTVRCRMWTLGTVVPHPDTCVARTLLRSTTRDFIWAIREFSTLQRHEERRLLFKVTSNYNMTLKLSLREKDGVEYISIYIEQSSNKNYDKILDMNLCLLDGEEQVVKSEKTCGFICFPDFFEKRRLMDNKQSLLPNDVLTLKCEVSMYPDIVWSRIENYGYSTNFGITLTGSREIEEQDGSSNEFSPCTEAMKSLFEDGTLSDVSLQTNTKSFPAHKCILSARSPVFKAMFSGELMEKTSNCVEIPDIEEKTLNLLLSYIYTDTIGQLQWQDAANLYIAADKYELLELKKKCAAFLKSELSVSSVCTILSVADMHNDQELLESAQDFVLRQEPNFFTSEDWNNFKKDNFKLYVKILELNFVNTNNRH